MITATLSTFEYYVAEHTDNGMSRVPERVAKDAVEMLAAQAEKIATLRSALDKIASNDTDGLHMFTPQAMQSIAREATTTQPTATTTEALERLVRLTKFELGDNAHREPWKRVLELAEAALSTAPSGDVREELHSCVCLLEVMAESAKERGDDVEWSMMSVMAGNGRTALSAGDGVPGMVLVPKAALDWLDGEGPDSEGRWFFEFPDGVEPPTEQYWWRTPFRKMLAASTAGGGK